MVFSVNLDKLKPGATYNVQVRGLFAEETGAWSTVYTFTTPTDVVSTTNTAANIELNGGSMYAGSFPSLPSLTSSSGVIFNKDGLFGYNTGSPTFYITASAGNAYFSGSITSSAGNIGGFLINSNKLQKTVSKNIATSYDPSFETNWIDNYTLTSSVGGTGSPIPNASLRPAYTPKYGYSGGLLFISSMNILRDLSFTLTSPSIAISANTQYTYSIYLKNSYGVVRPDLTIQYYSGSGLISSSFVSASVFAPSVTYTGYTRSTYTFTTPASTTYIKYIFTGGVAGSDSISGDSLFFDGLQIESGSVATAWDMDSNIKIVSFAESDEEPYRIYISDNTSSANVLLSLSPYGALVSRFSRIDPGNQSTTTSSNILNNLNAPIQIGGSGLAGALGQNLKISNDSIQSVASYNSTGTLNINPAGGSVIFGGNISGPNTLIYINGASVALGGSATVSSIAASALTGTTLASNVINSSLTSFGTSPSFTGTVNLGSSIATGSVQYSSSTGYIAAANVSGSVTSALNSASLGGIAAASYAQLSSANFTAASIGGNAIATQSYVTSNIKDSVITVNASAGALINGTSTDSFTLNQASNKTLAITTNGASANTANTLVLRDASGNFVAGTITATLTGVASSATNLALTTASTNATTFIPFFSANSSTTQAASVTANLSFNPSTGTLTATSFVGSHSGNGSALTSLTGSAITGSVTSALSSASSTITNDAATATPLYLTFVSASTGNAPIKTTAASLTYTPSTGIFAAPIGSFSGSINVTGNVVYNQTTNSQSGSAYTLALTDSGKFVEMTSSAANTITVPAATGAGSVAWVVGTRIDIIQYGAGTTTITPASGASVNYYSPTSAATRTIKARYGAATLIYRATNEWLLIGNLT